MRNKNQFTYLLSARAPRRSEIRKDYIQEKYVIIAPVRRKRPSSNLVLETVPTKEDECVFCQQAVNAREDILYRSPESGRWKIAVVPNIYPSVSVDNKKAYGVQEVIIETPDPAFQLHELSVAHIARVFHTYALRTREVTKVKDIQYILIFKNSGGRAGATIRHAHSQLFATAFVPPHIADKSFRVRQFRSSRGKCVYCEVVKIERKSQRFIAQAGGVVAFAPYASMHNYEVWIMPKRHIDKITELNPFERLGMAKLLKQILGKIGRLNLPYNFYFHQTLGDPDQHLYLKVTPRGTIWAGVEIGSGLIINPVAPEDAAEYYRGS